MVAKKKKSIKVKEKKSIPLSVSSLIIFSALSHPLACPCLEIAARLERQIRKSLELGDNTFFWIETSNSQQKHQVVVHCKTDEKIYKK